MNDTDEARLRSILDDFEAGKIADRELDVHLEKLSHEQLGWIAHESIRRAGARAHYATPSTASPQMSLSMWALKAELG